MCLHNLCQYSLGKLDANLFFDRALTCTSLSVRSRLSWSTMCTISDDFVSFPCLFFFALLHFADVPVEGTSPPSIDMRFFNSLFHVPWNDFFEFVVTIRISSRYRLLIVDLTQLFQLRSIPCKLSEKLSARSRCAEELLQPKTCELPEGSTITVGTKRFRCAEVLLQPSLQPAESTSLISRAT